MKSVIHLFDPRKQNNIQKTGLFIALVIMTLIIGLHNPTEGYKTESWISPPKDCEPFDQSSICRGFTNKLDFFSWQSLGASLQVFETIGSTLMWFFLLFVCLLAFLLIFSDYENHKG